MEEDGGRGISESELTCAICTEILFQPLALLDCLHTFCGACLKEWFKWQATSASQSRRNIANPYTCPSCRESVRRTKADWRLNTLLEGFLKAHPNKVKDEHEVKELGEHYKPGENVLPPVVLAGNEDQDGRILARTRDLSLNSAHAGARGQRSERSTQHRQAGEERNQSSHLTESRLRQHEASQPRIEHQSSLRSLLSASDSDQQQVQAEILRSIYTEGLLDGIDLDNLTPEQEEDLTERIAEAYRRRQRNRERSRDREDRQQDDRSTLATVSHAESHTPRSIRRDSEDAMRAPLQSRSRPPVSRPHLFEQTLQAPRESQRRSRSSTSQRTGGSDALTPPGSRSATDLSQRPSTAESQRTHHLSGSERNLSNPDSVAARPDRARVSSNDLATTTSGRPVSSGSNTRDATRHSEGIGGELLASSRDGIRNQVRPAVSTAALAPEPVVSESNVQDPPSISCNRCERANIQFDLHYNCRWCLGGGFYLCLNCYRAGRGCNHWFGFGFRAFERWFRNAPPEGWPIGFDRPHVLTAQRHIRASNQQDDNEPQSGAFCESCLAFANDCYWYCNVCLEGAWGFCDNCVKRGMHCTHPLLVVAHINTLQGGHCDPSKLAFVGLPHLRQDTYANLPLSTGCDICHRSISPASPRFHCYQCNDGDYDICNECYHHLVAQGKISQVSGPNGWRRCLKGHRMAVVGFQQTSQDGHVRTTIREPVGGWSLKDDGASSNSQPPSSRLPPDGGTGMRGLALYNYFPKEGVVDELAFPKNAEIREIEDRNGDWYVGAYAGKVNLFPSNHVRIL